MVHAIRCNMEGPTMNDRAAYVIFVTGVFMGLALLTAALVAIAVGLIRQHRRDRPR